MIRCAHKALMVIAVTLASCATRPAIPAATPATQTITTLRLEATTSTAPLIYDLTQMYDSQIPNLTFEIGTNTYTTLIDQVMNGQTDYFLTNHFPDDVELWAAPIGFDGLAIITHPANPVSAITSAQLRAIYRGDLTNWNTIGGASLMISVVSRERSADTRLEFNRMVTGDMVITPSARLVPSDTAMLETVASTPGSIGYLSFVYLNPSVRPLRLDDVDPTHANLLNNIYPLRSTLFLIGRDEPIDRYRAFIGWVQSPDGQAIIAERYAPLLSP